MAIAQISNLKMIDLNEVLKALRPEIISLFDTLREELSQTLDVALQVNPNLVIKRDNLNKAAKELSEQLASVYSQAELMVQKKLDGNRKYKGKSDDFAALEKYRNERAEKIRLYGTFDKKGRFTLNRLEDIKDFVKDLKVYEDANRQFNKLLAEMQKNDPNFKYKRDKNDIDLSKLIPDYKLDGSVTANAEAMAKAVGDIYKNALDKELATVKAERDEVMAQYNQDLMLKALRAKGVNAASAAECNAKARDDLVKAEASERKSEKELQSLIQGKLDDYKKLDAEYNELYNKDKLDKSEKDRLAELRNELEKLHPILKQARELMKEFGLEIDGFDDKNLKDALDYKGLKASASFGKFEAEALRTAKADTESARQESISAERSISELKDLLSSFKDIPEFKNTIGDIAQGYVDASIAELQRENTELKQKLSDLETRISTFESIDVQTRNDGLNGVARSVDNNSPKGDNLHRENNLHGGGNPPSGGSPNNPPDFTEFNNALKSSAQTISSSAESVASSLTKLKSGIDVVALASPDIEQRINESAKALSQTTKSYISAANTIVKTQEEYQRLSQKDNRTSKEQTRFHEILNQRKAARDVMDNTHVDHETFMQQRARMESASRLATETILKEAEAERELARAEAEQAAQAKIVADEEQRRAELNKAYQLFDFATKNTDRYIKGQLLGDTGNDWENFASEYEKAYEYAKNYKSEIVGIREAREKLAKAEKNAYDEAEIQALINADNEHIQLIVKAVGARKEEARVIDDMARDVERAFATNTSSKLARDLYDVFNLSGIIDEQIQRDKAFTDLISKYEEYQHKISKLEAKQLTVGLTPNQSSDLDNYKIQIEELDDALEELEKKYGPLEHVMSISDGIRESVNKMAKTGQKDIDSYNKVLTEFNKNFAFIQTLPDDSEESIKGYLQKYVKGEGGKNLKELKSNGVKNGVMNFTTEFTNAHGVVQKLNLALNTTDNTLRGVVKDGGNVGNIFSGLIDAISNKWKNFIAYLSSGAIVYKVWDILKRGVIVVKELDAAFVELKRISNDSASALEDFRRRLFELADTVGTTSATIINAATEWEHLGYSIKEAEELAKTSAVYKNIADGMTSDSEATEDLVSILKAYNFSASQAMDVTDALIATSNNYAVTAADIGNILKRSSAALAMGGNTFEETVALGTAMNEVLQLAEVAGSSLKVLSLRLRSSKTELADMGEETDNLVESTPKLRAQIKALTNGFDILLSDGKTIKSTYDIMKGIASVWKDMSDVNQAALLELIAGKTRAQGVSALLSNWDQVDNVLKTIAEDEGTALRNNEEKLNTINGRIIQLTNASQRLALDAFSTEFIKDFISAGTDAVNLLDLIINKIGTIPTVIGAIGAASTFTEGGGQPNPGLTTYKATGIVRGNTKQIDKSMRLCVVKPTKLAA